MSVLKTYGSLVAYEASQLIEIYGVNQYHGVLGLSEGVNVHGLTFLASATGSITNTANNGGLLRCTDIAHGLTTGQYITLVGMGDALHVGLTEVTVIDVNTFDCVDISYNSISDTGTWIRGSSFTVDSGHGGKFWISLSSSIRSSGNSKDYRFELCKNTEELDETAVERQVSVGTDIGSLSIIAIIPLSGGDTIYAVVKGITDATNLTIEHFNVSMVKF